MTAWDQRFFDLVALMSTWSEDRGRKVAAVIVGNANEILATGYNGFPRGVSAEFPERHSREMGEKYYWVEHAERNAIYNAARAGTSVAGAKIYVSLFPCADCSRAIIQSGIVELNTFAPPEGDQKFGRSFEVGVRMLEEASVAINCFQSSPDPTNHTPQLRPPRR